MAQTDTDDTIKCWYCHKNTMILDPVLNEGWYKCTSCAATWHKPHETTFAAVTYEVEEGTREIIAHPRAIRRT